jgi:hypothetical protein
MPGLRGGAPEQAEEEEEKTYLEGAEQEDFQEIINSLSKHATAIMEHLYDVFHGRTCGGILAEISGNDTNNIITLIAPLAGYLTMFQDFLKFNRKSGWWVTDPHLLAIATNMKGIENLYAKHLDKGCVMERPGADISLITFRAELEKLLVNLKSENMRRRFFKESISIRTPSRTPSRTPASVGQRATFTPLRTPSAPILNRVLGIQSLKGKKKVSKFLVLILRLVHLSPNQIYERLLETTCYVRGIVF